MTTTRWTSNANGRPNGKVSGRRIEYDFSHKNNAGCFTILTIALVILTAVIVIL